VRAPAAGYGCHVRRFAFDESRCSVKLDVRSWWDWCRDVIGRGPVSPRTLWGSRLRTDHVDA
jgi:hypothetical protein